MKKPKRIAYRGAERDLNPAEFPECHEQQVRASVSLILAAGLISSYPLLFAQPFYSHDLEHHLPRLAQYFAALQSGQFPVRWLPDLMGGYGLPTFVYIPPLAYMLGALLQFMGIGLLYTYKMLLLVTILFSGIAMYSWAREYISSSSATVASFAYMFAPYRFVDIYVRGALPEALSFVFLPLIFLSIHKLWRDPRPVRLVLLSIVLAGLLFSHNITALGGYGLAVLYGGFLFWRHRDTKAAFLLASGFALALSISATYWVPAIFEMKYVYMGDSSVGDVQEGFIYPIQLLSSLWGYGYSAPGIENDGMSFQIGNFIVAGFILFSIDVWRTKGMIRSDWPFFLVVIVGSIFLTLSVSAHVWDTIPLMRFFQFPWRLLAFITFVGSFCFGRFCDCLLEKPAIDRAKWWMAFALLAFMLDCLGWIGLDQYSQPIPRNFSLLRVLLSTLLSAIASVVVFRKDFSSRSLTACLLSLFLIGSLPLWSLHLQRAILGWPQIFSFKNVDFKNLRRSFVLGDNHFGMVPQTASHRPILPALNPLAIPEGSGAVIRDVDYRGHKLEFSINGTNQVEVAANVFYFPGWRISIDGIFVEPSLDRVGRMLLAVPPGDHRVKISFGSTPLRSFADCLSLAGLAFACLLSVGARFPTRHLRRVANFTPGVG
ncbi:MAG: 6-pyruvoyl-tetrahydropterin synthase-related protein [Syntrophobacteraceae bacterium]